MAAARGTQRAANCLATPLQDRRSRHEFFHFPKQPLRLPMKTGALDPGTRPKGALSSGFGEALCAQNEGWGLWDTLPLLSAGGHAGDPHCTAVRNDYRVI